jgi:hypothetical protein
MRYYMIRCSVALLLAAGASTLMVSAAEAPNPAFGQENQKQKQKESKKDSTATLTGCVDEPEGRYVMISEQSRDVIADLAADGFETEGFAKHVGHKVTVRGTSNPGTTRPLFRVRSVETISDACATHSLN